MKKSANEGTLLLPKHYPNILTITWDTYRTILTLEMSCGLGKYVESGNYTINQYQDAKYSNGAGYYELIPNPSSGFSVVGSGIASGSITPHEAEDRFVLVSVINSGWHIYADNSS